MHIVSKMCQAVVMNARDAMAQRARSGLIVMGLAAFGRV